MTKPEWVLGHEPPEAKLNVRRELRRLRRDPLDPFIEALGRDSGPPIIHDEIGRYREAYRFYYLSLERFLPEMSLAIRWSTGPYYVLKYGGRYTPTQRKLSAQYHKISKFVELDFFNCILHARIVLDRAIGLSRYFIRGDALPSFTSFADHKKFFQRRKVPFGEFEEYAKYIREQTSWFEVPVKLVRDKYLVHAGPRHIRVFGYPAGDTELGLMVFVPATGDPRKEPARAQTIVVSVPRLAWDTEQFLTWLSAYGCRALRNQA